ncbi:hypothetical protein L6164_000256 [Bauhinia variegata]|uniref:Uncharacterized protein n=1 Tax=Bauhinia variegata TaxID=167791 RepID=A0ACB9Q5D6_BAUVA|nr:hypothetical protein L6164_000256 [Bauhinia variegata]
MALLFRNYIGPKSQTIDINFTDVPIYSNINFHFLLAFARDYDKQNFLTNGYFFNYWNENNFWSFAATSVNKIIDEYNLDGIDVNYSHVKGSEDDFAYCIGELIKMLKESTEEGKFLASITVSHSVQADYLALYNKYKQYIDYVGYQFYAESHSIQNVTKLREHFTDVSDVFSISKLIAGFSSVKAEEEKLAANVFFKGSETLKADNILDGIVIWSADESKPGFENERKLKICFKLLKLQHQLLRPGQLNMKSSSSSYIYLQMDSSSHCFDLWPNNAWDMHYVSCVLLS